MKKNQEFKIKEIDLNGQRSIRLDHFLNQKYPDLTRNYLQKIIKDGLVLVNNKKAKASKKIKPEDLIKINFAHRPSPINLKPEKIDLDIIYEDKNILVINKPAGLVVHPGAGNQTGTLVNALLNYLPELKNVGDELRCGIVHRLDKDTSGVMVIAKNNLAFKDLIKQFKERKIQKEYLALVYGKIQPKKGKIVAPIGRNLKNRTKMSITGMGQGKEAETEYEVERCFGGDASQCVYTLLKVYPKTGRTHQVRVHLNSIGYPVVGDKVYRPRQNFIDKAKELGLTRQFLHARSIEIEMFVPRGGMPLRGKRRKKFIAPLAGDLENILKQKI